MGRKPFKSAEEKLKVVLSVRFFESIKYDHLYRHEIPNGQVLHEQVQAYRKLYNEIRPNESFEFRTPAQAYLAEVGIEPI